MRKFTLFKKILLAMLTLAMVPLLCSSLILFLNLQRTSDQLADKIALSADRQASESLEMRAQQVAAAISGFLKGCEADLLLLAALPHDPATLAAFDASRKGEIWYRTGGPTAPREARAWVPRYASLEITDRSGMQRFVIRNGRVIPPTALQNVANPANTEFKSEDYFPRTARLNKGEIYVSHLTGFHLSKDEQLAGAADPEIAFGGKQYRGVIRFATPLLDSAGSFVGIAVLSLDHRHLMEFTQHISPGTKDAVVFPSYKSGNYAFLFDDQGWIITHPKFWDIRGVDRQGKQVPPYTERSSREDVDRGRIPYNLDFAGFIHPNYPVVARQVREKTTGAVDITNVGGAKKLMAYAPILYETGDYRKHGIFGAVTIGFQVDQFHEAARAGSNLINRQLRKHLRLSTLIVALTFLTVLACAWLLSRGITRPLALLTRVASRVASGETASQVEIASGDEVGELANSFNRMAEELELRKKRLLRTLEELRSSRREILAERNFKESVLESISSGIFTFSPNGRLTSINTTGRQLLGERAALNAHYSEFLAGWGDIIARLSQALDACTGYGRRPLSVEIGGKNRFFDVGVFPIGDELSSGITVTIRDETEKERMREEMTRLDRLASLGKMSAGIAHEVRNPLTGVSLLLDDLHDRAATDPESQLLMRKALAEIERVERLIAALLNFSSPPKAEFREGELNRVVQDTLLLLRRECGKQGVELRFTPEEMPPFRFDIEKIKQALLNLVKNALEAMQQGGTIEVATAAEADQAVITVTDNGPGIAPQDLSIIFEPFFTRKGAGTGLGLSITQRIVEEHHGKISVKSNKRAGTVFVIQLPMKT